MEIRREQIDQVLITMVTPTLVTLIPMATPEAHHPPQLTTSATRLHPIETGTDTPKVLPLPLPITMETVALNSAAITPAPPFGHGKEEAPCVYFKIRRELHIYIIHPK